MRKEQLIPAHEFEQKLRNLGVFKMYMENAYKYWSKTRVACDIHLIELRHSFIYEKTPQGLAFWLMIETELEK